MLECSLGKFLVAEISEEGVRILIDESDDRQLAEGASVEATITFCDHQTESVSGHVLRSEIADLDYHCVIRLTCGITLKRVLAEQRFLLRIYPSLVSSRSVDNRDAT